MATYQYEYNFADKVKGDTLEPITFTVTVNAAPLNLTNCTILIQFKKQPCLAYDYQMGSSVAIGGVTITDAVNGEFRIDEQVLNWKAAKYYYDIQFTWTDGTVKTYIGGTIEIKQDVTR